MRKLKNQVLLPSLVAILSILFSCTKESNSLEPTQGDQAIMLKTKAWLDNQKAKVEKEKAEKIELLKTSLDFTRAWKEELNVDEDLIIIPIKTSFKTINNKDKAVINYLVLIEDENANIRKGNIFQYLPEGSTGNSIPRNSISKMYDGQPTDMTGRMTVLTINDKFVYEISFKNGKKNDLKVLSTEDPNRPAWSVGRSNTTCIDWYIVTTYYNAYGEVIYQTSDYVGTTCDGCTPLDPYLQSLDCSSSGGGGGWGSGELATPVSKPVFWKPAENVNGWWYVRSGETLYGDKFSVGGYFTSAVHNSDYMVNVVPNYAIWTKASGTTRILPSGLASASMLGDVTFTAGGPPVSVNNVEAWLFEIEFP